MPRPARPRVVTLLVGALAFSLLASNPAETARGDTRPAQPARVQPSAAARTAVPLADAPGPVPARKARQQSVAVIAHRGASAYAPENTLAAVRKGVTQDADMVEVDIRQTKDGELVAMHDSTLARTTDVEDVFPGRAPYRVADFTLREIRKLDAGSWKHSGFAGERVPTLRQVLGTLEGSGVGLMLEAKDPARHPGMGERIARELRGSRPWRSAGATELTVLSFDWTFQRDFSRLAPDYAVGLIGMPADGELDDVADWARSVNPRRDDLDRPLVQLIHDAGMWTYPWTVDEPAEMRRFISYGVDGILTDKPDVLNELLRKRHAGQRSRTESRQGGTQQPEAGEPARERGETTPAADGGDRRRAAGDDRGRKRSGSSQRDDARRHQRDRDAEDDGNDHHGTPEPGNGGTPEPGNEEPPRDPGAGDHHDDRDVPEPGRAAPPERDHQRALPSPGHHRHRALPTPGRHRPDSDRGPVRHGRTLDAPRALHR